jgi:selenide, water dikinase
MDIKLTQYSKGSGCGCKIAPNVLEEILKNTKSTDTVKQLLVGNEHKDDAAVWKLDDEKAIISTTDFFTPIVNNPFAFGQIAAANALSDVYAMGGKPLMALSVLGWPIEKLSVEICAQVIEGAHSICKQAGIILAGGHSIDISEPVFGLSVTGLVHPDRVKKNSTARAGDLIYISKPIGSGILASALKREILNDAHYSEFIKWTTMLNDIGSELGNQTYINALTDITGFGLCGHLNEICEASSVSAEIVYTNIPFIDGINTYVEQFCFPDNTTRNLNAYKDKISGMDGLKFIPLCDPQTNGGLLICVKPENKNEFETLFNKKNKPLWLIGEITSKSSYNIVFK